MTPVQIAYFKHFLYDTGLHRMYIYRYRHYRLTDDKDYPQGNPESIEQFFLEYPRHRMIMKAFYFEVNSQYGYDFWKEINDKWNKYWELNKDNLINSKYILLKGSFSILRQNWDKPKYWKEIDSFEETYKRMGIEQPLLETYIDTDNLKELSAPEEPESVEEPKESNPGSLLEGFSLVETRNHVGGRAQSANIVTVNLRNNGYRITFSAKVSEKLRKQGYEYVKLLTKKDTKEIALIFNHLSGCNVTIKKATDCATRNVTINSKDVVTHIHDFYELKKVIDYFCLDITATIQQDNNTIFKLSLHK